MIRRDRNIQLRPESPGGVMSKMMKRSWTEVSISTVFQIGTTDRLRPCLEQLQSSWLKRREHRIVPIAKGSLWSMSGYPKTYIDTVPRSYVVDTSYHRIHSLHAIRQRLSRFRRLVVVRLDFLLLPSSKRPLLLHTLFARVSCLL